MSTIATATVKGGFWPQNGITSLGSVSGRGFARRQVARMLGLRGSLKNRALLTALNGVAPGGAALKTLGRVENNTELGGKRTIETNTLVNRVTAAGDVTELNADYLTLSSRTTFGTSPPVNKDGNPLGTR